MFDTIIILDHDINFRHINVATKQLIIFQGLFQKISKYTYLEYLQRMCLL